MTEPNAFGMHLVNAVLQTEFSLLSKGKIGVIIY
jgi:hypothetical protein